jgi:hypothetical protein
MPGAEDRGLLSPRQYIIRTSYLSLPLPNKKTPNQRGAGRGFIVGFILHLAKERIPPTSSLLELIPLEKPLKYLKGVASNPQIGG